MQVIEKFSGAVIMKTRKVCAADRSLWVLRLPYSKTRCYYAGLLPQIYPPQLLKAPVPQLPPWAAAGLPAAAAAPEQENGLFSRVTPRSRPSMARSWASRSRELPCILQHPLWRSAGRRGPLAGPLDPVPWAAVRDCTCPGPEASQYRCGLSGVEDCLRLDVYTTARARRLPVLVFLHSGGNQTGSAQELRGHRLVERAECVVVSVDYRLGLLGFNCLPALCAGADTTGNFALLDIAKALDWVRENIAAFGGDPDDLTLAGFEAGGRDVLAMLASPLGQGRFQRAVCLSGGMTTAQPQPSAQKIAAAFAPLAVQDGLFASEAEAAAWLLTPEPEVRRWLCGLDVARLAPVMSMPTIAWGPSRICTPTGVFAGAGLCRPAGEPRAVDAGHWLYGIQPDGAVGGSPGALPAQPRRCPAGEQAINLLCGTAPSWSGSSTPSTQRRCWRIPAAPLRSICVR